MTEGKQSLRVLIVDDEECIREFLGYAIEKRGFVVEKACNGKEALEKVAASKPDIIILDFTMPILNGFEVCKQLKDNKETQDIPIIFLSAQDCRDKISKNTPGAEIKFIDKPCDFKYLLSEINNSVKDKTGGS